MLPLVGGTSQYQGILYPNAHAANVEARFLEGSAEVETFRVSMEDVGAASFGQMRGHIAERSQQKLVELLVRHAVVLDGFAVRRFIRKVVRRVRENACVALNQDDYNTRYQALCDQHDAIQARLDSLEAEIKRRKLRRSDIDRFIGDLMRQPAIITTFDPILWSTMVERVTVHGKNDIRFTFRNGTEITA